MTNETKRAVFAAFIAGVFAALIVVVVINLV